MPLTAKILVGSLLFVLLGGAIWLINARGPAVLLDMAANAAAFICF